MKKSTFKNIDAIPTKKIKEILNDPDCKTSTGRDYGPVKHELEDILFYRMDKERGRAEAQMRREQKAQFKAWASAHKRK